MKFLLSVAVALFMSFPASAGIPHTANWYCMQIGHLNKQPVMIVSELQDTPYKDLRTREKAFAAAVKKTWKITGAYEPLCQDFHTKKEANYIIKHVIKKAKRAGLDVLMFEFKLGGKYVWKEKAEED